jgi:hypothetical protein
MSKNKTTKYPTLRVRVTQEQFDKAYRIGWPDCVKQFINASLDPKTIILKNDKETPAEATKEDH